MVVGSLLRSEGTAAPVFSQVHQEQIVAVETTQNIVTPVQYAAPTMTGTRVDVNRIGTPDVLQQPQLEHMDTMTVTDADMNRHDIPDFLQQPQFGLAPQGYATLVLHGAPVTTVGMNCLAIQTYYSNPRVVFRRRQ